MSSLIHGLFGAMQGTFGARNSVPTTRLLSVTAVREQPHALYSLMRTLSANTSAYKDLAELLPDYGLDSVAMQGLRNPTHAVCGFYEANLYPGTIREDDDRSALPLETPDVATVDKLHAGIHQVWRWSNWNDNKDGAAYDAAMLGDQVFKIRSDERTRRSWFELVPPDYMTDLDVDGRGYLTYIRLDVPQVRRKPDGSTETFIHTEVWDKQNMRYRRWERTDLGVSGIDQLGEPVEDEDMEQVFGVDFVPFVHWQFDRESGNLRGVPAVMRALDKILYGDALVTALHRRLSREVDWLLKSPPAVDADGIPLPPPSLDGGGQLEVGSGRMHALPAGWDIASLIAGLDYASHLAVVQEHYKALQETDLPELAWGSISESGGDLSGRALNYKLTPAKSRLEKARGRAESALIRATQMCLSVAQQLDAPGFGEAEIGTYARGDLDFWIADREIVPLSEAERSEVETQKTQRIQQLTQAGMSIDGALAIEGFTDEQIEQALNITSGIER
jgi:hypothetical protein